MSNVKPVPDGFNTLSPYLIVGDANEAMDWYQKAFGAEEVERMLLPDGKTVMHGELRIGDSMLMLSQASEQWGSKCPKGLGGTPASVHIYVNDVDAAWNKAIDAGAKELYPVMDTFWGDRFGKLEDPFGHHWSIATHIKDLTPEEITQGAMEWMKNMAEGDCGKS